MSNAIRTSIAALVLSGAASILGAAELPAGTDSIHWRITHGDSRTCPSWRRCMVSEAPTRPTPAARPVEADPCSAFAVCLTLGRKPGAGVDRTDVAVPARPDGSAPARPETTGHLDDSCAVAQTCQPHSTGTVPGGRAPSAVRPVRGFMEPAFANFI